MSEKVKFGDILVLTFTSTSKSPLVAFADKKACFVDREETELPQVGETWLVKVVGSNKDDTYNFVSLITPVNPRTSSAPNALVYPPRCSRGNKSWSLIQLALRMNS